MNVAPIGRIATGLDMIFINAATGVKTLKDLAVYTKRNPGGTNYGAPFLGSSAHLTMEMIKRDHLRTAWARYYLGAMSLIVGK